jgi:hypothetical protein
MAAVMRARAVRRARAASFLRRISSSSRDTESVDRSRVWVASRT